MKIHFRAETQSRKERINLTRMVGKINRKKNKELDGKTSHPDVRFSQASVVVFLCVLGGSAWPSSWPLRETDVRISSSPFLNGPFWGI
jgi:hypothetical protein